MVDNRGRRHHPLRHYEKMRNDYIRKSEDAFDDIARNHYLRSVKIYDDLIAQYHARNKK